MGKKITLQEARQEFINRNYIPLFNKYDGANKSLLAKTKDGYLVVTRLGELKNGNMPAIFYQSNPYMIQNIKLWCKLNNKPFELLSEDYVSYTKKLKWKCLKFGCNEEFEISWHDVFNGYGCGFCHGLQVGLSNCLATKNPELAKEWHPTKNGDLTPYDITSNSHKKVWWKCSKCKYEWKATIYNRNKNNGTNCPLCNKSKGEKNITKYLDYNNINYIPQKEFNGLIGINNGNLSYDFYLPEYNLLIEYQGEFHDNDGGNGREYIKKNFERQQEHDKRKREYAQKHNIKLLEIWYWDFDNIEKILKDFLSKNQNN